jgi:hypothetical protein
VNPLDSPQKTNDLGYPKDPFPGKPIVVCQSSFPQLAPVGIHFEKVGAIAKKKYFAVS